MTTSATYVDRYRAGEREIVWRELMELGPRVRESAYLSDARAVTHEIMYRARQNLETIIDRLRSRGYVFADAQPPLRPRTPELFARLDRVEARYGMLPLALRAFYDVVGEVSLTGSLAGLSGVAPSPSLSRLVADTRAALGVEETAGDVSIDQARATVDELIRRMADPGPERHTLARKLAQQMAVRKAGSWRAIIVSDPIVVLAPPTDELFDPATDDDDPDPDDQDLDARGELAIDIAPDSLHKANLSGGVPYSIAIPNPGVDGAVRGTGAPSLVEYLREAFRWGGFPGIARVQPATQLDWLTSDLLPI